MDLRTDNKSELYCREFELRIQHRLDHRLALDEARLVAHASNCACCRALLNDYREMFALLDSSNLIAESGSVGVGIALGNGSRRGFGWMAGPILVLAAVLLLVISVFPTTPNSSPRMVFEKSQIAALEVDSTARMISPVSVADHALSDNAFEDILLQYQPALFTLATSTPQLVDAVGIPSPNSWQRLSGNLDPTSPYWRYSSELPGVQPIKNSVQLTLDLLQRSLNRADREKPDLGYVLSHPLAAV